VPAARATHGMEIVDAATAAPIPFSIVRRDEPANLLLRVVMHSSFE
jgi:hypothetical protein